MQDLPILWSEGQKTYQLQVSYPPCRLPDINTFFQFKKIRTSSQASAFQDIPYKGDSSISFLFLMDF